MCKGAAQSGFMGGLGACPLSAVLGYSEASRRQFVDSEGAPAAANGPSLVCSALPRSGYFALNVNHFVVAAVCAVV